MTDISYYNKHYNARGQVTSSIESNKEHAVFFRYDAKGNMVCDSSAWSDYPNKMYHHYNADGQRIGQVMVWGEGDTAFMKRHHYNERGLMDRSATVEQKEGEFSYEAHLYRYNDEGQMTEHYSLITFNWHNKFPRSVRLPKDDPNDAWGEREYRSYNSDGLLTEQRQLFADAKYVIRYEYTMDARGNWIERRKFVQGELAQVRQREIRYRD